MKLFMLLPFSLLSLFAFGQDSLKEKIRTYTVNIDSLKRDIAEKESVDYWTSKPIITMERGKIGSKDSIFGYTPEAQSNLLSISVLAFGLILSIAVMIWLYKMKKGLGTFSFKTLGIILILTACLFLVVAGYDVEQITPVIGLLGTIAGFIFGSSSNNSNSTREQGEH